MLNIDRFSRKPIYEQIIMRFEFLIANNQIPPDEPMPSVRSLSQELSVNPNTLQKAYAELERRGLCYTLPGNGRYVSKNARELLFQNETEYFDQLDEALLKLQQLNVSLEQITQHITENYNSNKQKIIAKGLDENYDNSK